MANARAVFNKVIHRSAVGPAILSKILNLAANVMFYFKFDSGAWSVPGIVRGVRLRVGVP